MVETMSEGQMIDNNTTTLCFLWGQIVLGAKLSQDCQKTTIASNNAFSIK